MARSSQENLAVTRRNADKNIFARTSTVKIGPKKRSTEAVVTQHTRRQTTIEQTNGTVDVVSKEGLQPRFESTFPK